MNNEFKFNFVDSGCKDYDEYIVFTETNYGVENNYGYLRSLEKRFIIYSDFLNKFEKEFPEMNLSEEPKYPKYLDSSIEIIKKKFLMELFRKRINESNYKINFKPEDFSLRELEILNNYDYNIIHYKGFSPDFDISCLRLLCEIKKKYNVDLGVTGLMNIKISYNNLDVISRDFPKKLINCKEDNDIKKRNNLLKTLSNPELTSGQLFVLIKAFHANIPLYKFSNPEYTTKIMKDILEFEKNNIKYKIVKINDKYKIEIDPLSTTINGNIFEQEGVKINFMSYLEHRRKRNSLNVYFDHHYDTEKRITLNEINYDYYSKIKNKPVIELDENESIDESYHLCKDDAIYLKDKKIFNIIVS